MWHESFKKMTDVPSLSLYPQWVARPGSSKWKNDPPDTVRKWVQESLEPWRKHPGGNAHAQGNIHTCDANVQHFTQYISASKVQKEEVNALMPTPERVYTRSSSLDEKTKEREAESLTKGGVASAWVHQQRGWWLTVWTLGQTAGLR